MRASPAATALLLCLLALPCASAAASESVVSPLPASDYAVRPVCPAPVPGYASCLALALIPRTAAARAHTHPLGITANRPIVAAKASEGAFGLRPRDLHSIYALPPTVASTQTIALVDAYNDLSAEADLKTYDEEFGLPPCTSAEACFEQVNQQGQSEKTGKLPFPASNKARAEEEAICKTGTGEEQEKACKEVEEAEGWAEEISLDIEVSHATCEHCKIVLVEADSASFSDLEAAEQAAVGFHATEISNSWGGPQPDETAAEDNASSFNHPGIVITAAAGDDGYLDWDAPESSTRGFADYPAASPHVVAVGGTRLQLPLDPGETWAGETVWNGDGAGGGGCSVRLTAPPWQQSTSGWESVGCGAHRAVADVAADADPYTGVAVYDSGFECEYEPHVVIHWCPIGGTSLASPLVASVFALAGGANGVAYPAQTLYENELEDPGTLHDVLSGSNGECTKPFHEEETFAAGTSGCTISEEAAQCSGKAICTAGPGYDGPTGVGTPYGILAFEPVSEKVKRANEEKLRTEEKLREEEQRREEEENRAVGPSSGAGTGPVHPSPTSVAPTSGASGSSSPGTTSPGNGAGQPTVKLSAFALTPTALLALDHTGSRASSIHFAFTLSAATRVRATLARLVRVRGHNRWKPVTGALEFTGAEGRNRRSLTSRTALTPGRFRLTLAPQGGAARTLTFQVG